MEKEIIEKIREALGEASVLFMSQEKKGTEIIMPTEELERIAQGLNEEIKTENKEEVNKLKEALIWCSGSEDFQEGGKARKGWLKILPFLK